MRTFVLAFFAVFMAASLEAGPLFDNVFNRSKKQDLKSPYQNFQYDKRADWERLTKLSISDVDVSSLFDSLTWRDASQAMKNDANMMALYMKTAFSDAVKARAGKTWALTMGYPENDTAILKLYIRKLTPPADNGKGTQGGEIAFEGKLVDKKTSAIIMSFSETVPLTVASKDDPWYGNSKDIIKTWAEDFAEMSMPEDKEDSSKLRKIARAVGIHFGIRKFMN